MDPLACTPEPGGQSVAPMDVAAHLFILIVEMRPLMHENVDGRDHSHRLTVPENGDMSESLLDHDLDHSD